MGLHHIALASRDIGATHDFYTEAMGFSLAKVVTAETPTGGWSKHVFYETGPGGMIAFWDLHDDRIPQPPPGGISESVGLPVWVNHLAFDAPLDSLGAYKERWLAWGTDVLWVDHEFVQSVYTRDPDGNMVEFCADVRPLDERDREMALQALGDPDPDLEENNVKGLWHPDSYHSTAVKLL